MELSPSVEASAPLLVLRYDPHARPSPRNAAGLYHYAILLPDRKSLGAAYVALGQAGVYFDGSADHLVSEAVYLTDPEGNGIELYADRPREQWTLDDARRLRMATLPLDLDALLAEARDVPQATPRAIAPGAQIGHVHLKVSALDRSVDFYRGMLGLDLMAHWGSAAFLSVGGYHHHVGLNTWESLGGPALPNGAAGLDYVHVRVSDRATLALLATRMTQGQRSWFHELGQLMVTDPDGIKLQITA